MKEIIKMYNAGATFVEIAKKYKKSRTTIRKILKESGIKIRGRSGYLKYQHDQNFFKEIDNQRKAYWLGFLLADGYHQETRNTLQFVLHHKDEQALIDFKEDLKYTGPVRENRHKQKHIFITSKTTSENLAKWNFKQNKSLTLEFPRNIPDYLMSHLIRGIFDGDGCISGKGHNMQFTIVSTEDVCQEINNIFAPLIGLKNLETHPNGITKRYRVSGRKQIEKLYHYLYNDAERFLIRKKQKMEELVCI